MSQSPYLDDLNKTLDNTIEMRDRLKFRISKLSEKLENKDLDEYDLNEYRILMIKSQGEVDAIEKVIAEKKQYFEQYAKEYELDRKETEKNYDSLIEKAKKVSSKIPAIHHSLSTVKWDVQEKSEEARVFFYKRLRDILRKENAL